VGEYQWVALFKVSWRDLNPGPFLSIIKSMFNSPHWGLRAKAVVIVAAVYVYPQSVRDGSNSSPTVPVKY
jgi:hypothetical protein